MSFPHVFPDPNRPDYVDVQEAIPMTSYPEQYDIINPLAPTNPHHLAHSHDDEYDWIDPGNKQVEPVYDELQ